MQKQRKRSVHGGFTLIELLVVISIIALLISILMPGLRNAREQAKDVACKSNLAGFGKGFYLYAGDNRDYLSSGSFDPEVSKGRDGPVDQVGWVADMVNKKIAFPGTALCASNYAMYNQKLGSKAAGKESYTPEQALLLIEKGYNTNYTQSWYMGRTEWDKKKAMSDSNPFNLKSLKTTRGPMRTSDMSRVSPGKVPLLGDGRTDLDNVVLGERSVKTMTDGPFGGPYGLQSYADFGPAHGFGKRIGGDKQHDRIRANILFGDAHVDVFQDNDRDGEFGIDNQVSPPEQKDLSQKDVFDGVLSLGRRSKNPFVLE